MVAMVGSISPPRRPRRRGAVSPISIRSPTPSADLGHPDAVDPDAVRRVEVGQDEHPVARPQPGVVARHLRVVEREAVVGRPADRQQRAVDPHLALPAIPADGAQDRRWRADSGISKTIVWSPPTRVGRESRRRLERRRDPDVAGRDLRVGDQRDGRPGGQREAVTASVDQGRIGEIAGDLLGEVAEARPGRAGRGVRCRDPGPRHDLRRPAARAPSHARSGAGSGSAGRGSGRGARRGVRGGARATARGPSRVAWSAGV